MKLVVGLRTAMATEILTFIDASLTNPATLQFYTGTMPVTMGQAIADTLLVTHTLPDPAGTVATGTFTGNAITNQNGVANGNAGWARLLDGDGLEVAYLTVGITGSGASVEMNTVQVVIGVPVSVTAVTFTLAGA